MKSFLILAWFSCLCRYVISLEMTELGYFTIQATNTQYIAKGRNTRYSKKSVIRYAFVAHRLSHLKVKFLCPFTLFNILPSHFTHCNECGRRFQSRTHFLKPLFFRRNTENYKHFSIEFH